MLATFGLVALISHVLPMSESVGAIVLLIGLAVGVDYTMFYLKREREERAAGRSEEAALEAAAATSGRAVLISGAPFSSPWQACSSPATRVRLLRRRDHDRGRGCDARIVDGAAGAALQARRQRRPARVPFVHRLRRDDGGGRFWGAIIDRVLRRPAVSAVVAGGLLVALAVPALQLHTAQPSIDTYPQNL